MVADGCVLVLESTRAVLVLGIVGSVTTPVGSLRRPGDGSAPAGDDLRACFIIEIMFPHSSERLEYQMNEGEYTG